MAPRSRTANLLIWLVWGPAILLWVFFLSAQQIRPTPYWLLDWHVYSAGAIDLLQQELYEVRLESPFRLPVTDFNYPPLAAALAIPLLLLPDGIAGTVWVLLNLVAFALTTVLAARLLNIPRPVLWGGIAFLAYTVHPWLQLNFLGNNTPIVVLLVIAFSLAHVERRDRLAGILLGVAIALKLWPAALLPLLVRERRWLAAAYATAIPLGTVALAFAWVGLEGVQPAFNAMQTRDEIEAGNHVFFISWLRESIDWWPWWGGYAIALTLAALPASGLLGLGLGIFAGLAAVPNLWRTYVPVMFIAGLMIVKAIARARAQRRERPAPTPLNGPGHGLR